MGVRILTWLLAFLFTAAGISKLIGVESVVDEFVHFGYPGWFRLLIGGLELLGGVGLMIAGTKRVAAAAMIVIMLGATWTLVQAGQAPFPPLVVGGMLAALLALDSRP
jgi:putative oxidoreductase